MRSPFYALVPQGAVFFLLLVIGAGWFLTVPKFLSPSSFLATVGLIAGCMWVTAITWTNARPANSLAQSLYDADLNATERRRIG